jgi:hypothetical protein
MRLPQRSEPGDNLRGHVVAAENGNHEVQIQPGDLSAMAIVYTYASTASTSRPQTRTTKDYIPPLTQPHEPGYGTHPGSCSYEAHQSP